MATTGTALQKQQPMAKRLTERDPGARRSETTSRPESRGWRRALGSLSSVQAPAPRSPRATAMPEPRDLYPYRFLGAHAGFEQGTSRGFFCSVLCARELQIRGLDAPCRVGSTVSSPCKLFTNCDTSVTRHGYTSKSTSPRRPRTRPTLRPHSVRRLTEKHRSLHDRTGAATSAGGRRIRQRSRGAHHKWPDALRG